MSKKHGPQLEDHLRREREGRHVPKYDTPASRVQVKEQEVVESSVNGHVRRVAAILDQTPAYSALVKELPDKFADELLLAEHNLALRTRVADLEAQLSDRDMQRAAKPKPAADGWAMNGHIFFAVLGSVMISIVLGWKIADSQRALHRIDRELTFVRSDISRLHWDQKNLRVECPASGDRCFLRTDP